MAIDSKIRSIIEVFGHIKIDDMMRQALSVNPTSYYQSQKSIGAQSDFITAPEISQLFGETIGIWIVNKWQELGSPKEFALVELGPGLGTLMHNIIRVLSLESKCLDAVQIYLFEINKNFIAKQKDNLHYVEKQITWLDKIENLPSKPSIIISNEFFDALPIKQYKRIREKWYELILVLDPLDSRLKFGRAHIPKALFNQLIQDYPHAQDGAVIEESQESLSVIRKIATHIAKYGGTCLAIDYGYNIHPSVRTRGQFHSTLQAVKNHQYQPIIDSLGEADLSAHVDFYALTNAASQNGALETHVSSQHDFLIRNGIKLRHNLLSSEASIENARILDKQLHRLIAKDQMGELFKVLEFK